MVNTKNIINELKVKGWSIRRAAKALGVTPGHLYKVITGERESRSLMERIENIDKSGVSKWQKNKPDETFSN